jgi:hypothetical protein
MCGKILWSGFFKEPESVDRWGPPLLYQVYLTAI